jgi:uncharacterized protein with ParB-like and HNH nuclease domain
MDSGLKKISDIFQGEVIFTIPQYQRAYSWDEKQWDEFYDDLHYHNINQKYFFGTLLLKDAGKEKSFNLIEVVDGQQRTTTITIFINVLLYLLEKKGSEKELELLKARYINHFNRYKLRPIDLDDVTFFHTYVLQMENETSSFNKPSQGRLYNAKIHFLKKLEKLDLPKLESYLDKIENAEILVYLVNNAAEASLIFETTNDRGKDLTNLEKIKSFLMYKAYLANTDATDLITRIFSRFSSIYKEIELIKPQFDENDINIVSEDQLTQYHFICYFGWGNKKEYQNYLIKIKSHINHLYNKQDYEKVTAFIEDYTKDLEDVFISFRKILTNPSDNFREIAFLGKVAVLFPLIIQAFRKDTSENKAGYHHFMTMLSKYAFRVFSLKAKRTNDVDSGLNILARDFKGDYVLLESELKSKMLEACPNEMFVKKLKDPDFYNEYSYETRIFILWKYENSKRTQNIPAYNILGTSTLFEQEDRLRFSAEHIHAQHSKYHFETAIISEEFAKEFLNCLGNLVLDSKSANSSKGKSEWDVKQANFFSSAPIISQNELGNFLENKVWDKESVQKRMLNLLSFAQKYWQ